MPENAPVWRSEGRSTAWGYKKQHYRIVKAAQIADLGRFFYIRPFGIVDDKEQDVKYRTEPGNKCL